VDQEQVEATLHEGVLAVRLRKASRTMPHTVEVEEG
jgi:HSP20 family molecular chaperone IbpA